MMESNFYSDEFERLIREKTEQYKMYPSEKVWKGVHGALHTRRKWFIVSMSLLVTGIIFFAGKELILPANHLVAAKKTTVAAIAGIDTIVSKTPGDNLLPGAFSGFKETAHSSINKAPDNRGAGLSPFTQTITPATTGALPSRVSTTRLAVTNSAAPVTEAHATIMEGRPIIAAIVEGRPLVQTLKDKIAVPKDKIAISISISKGEKQKTDKTAKANNQEDPVAGNGDPLVRNGDPLVRNDEPFVRNEDPLAGKSDIAAENIVIAAGNIVIGKNPVTSLESNPLTTTTIIQKDSAGLQRINWLQDYAVYSLPPSNRKGRKSLVLYFSPTVNYRTLSGGNYISPKSYTQSVPLALTHSGQANDFVDHKPALGLEAGANLLYKLTRNLTLKAGLQFNYIRYTIKAYAATGPERATIALNPYYGYYTDSLTAYSSISNLGGKKQETLNNEYYHISMPVGFELRLMGNGRLQLNIAATIQPTYLLNTNSYLLTTDYSNYTRQPSLFRRWNVNGGVEAFISYKTGSLRWQIGPELRYQLFSTYNNQYAIREHLKEYGLKIGISKTIR